MAGVRKKGESYYCTFRFQGKRYYFAIGTVTEEQAKAKGVEVDETLDLIERGRLQIPEGVLLEEFVSAGGKAPVVSARPETITAKHLFDHYLATHANGTIETSSLATARTHLSQVTVSIGERFRVQSLTLLSLQDHVERRRKKGISPVTLKKEIATFRACWNWAAHGGLVRGVFPGKGLRFPKEEEKEPFRTFADILAIVEGETPEDSRKEALWESLYLNRAEVEEFLTHVKENATLPWVYPMVALAAYTGARRSEMLRMLAADADLVAGVVTIREKKRVKGRRSTRNAPVTPRLTRVLRDWLAVKPEGPPVLPVGERGAQQEEAGVPHGRHRGRGPRPLQEDGRRLEVVRDAGLAGPPSLLLLEHGSRRDRPADHRRDHGALDGGAAQEIPPPRADDYGRGGQGRVRLSGDLDAAETR